MQLKLANLLVFLIGLPLVRSLLPTKLLFQYPEGSWVENLAVRRNGSLLFTSLDFPGELHTLNPFDGSSPVLVASFPSFNSTLGIIETTPDSFYVLTSNFTFAGANPGTQPGSDAVFHVDFASAEGQDKPIVEKLVEVTGAKELNGLTAFNDTLLFAADSALGAVWAINTVTGSATIVAQDPLMAPEGTIDGISLGINGLHFLDGTLYFTNTQQSLFAKMEFDSNAQPTGPAVVVAHALVVKGAQTSWDDFTLDSDANAFVATPIGNSVQLILPNGSIQTLAGSLNSTALAQPTSAKFGRTPKDLDVLYVTTAGGLAEPVVQDGKSVVVGAQIVAVNLRHRSPFWTA